MLKYFLIGGACFVAGATTVVIVSHVTREKSPKVHSFLAGSAAVMGPRLP